MKTVVVVDDEFDLTSTLKAILEHEGYRAETCSDGREALACIERARPDVVLLDVMLPLGSGFDVLDRIRESPEFAETPVVLMNSVPPPLARPVRWQAFLQKPLTIPPLLDALERLVGRSAPGGAGGD